MRFRASSTFIYPVLLAFTVSTGLLLNAGCGGGSSSPRPGPSTSASPTPTPTASATPTPGPVNVRTRILWGPRSGNPTRQTQVTSPSSALSVRVTLTGNEDITTGQTATQVFDRSQANVSGTEEVYPMTAQLRPGRYTLAVVFYAQYNGAGDVVGTASTTATVLPNTGEISTTIATIGNVRSVAILPGQSVQVGQTTNVNYEVRDAGGTVLAITRGSGFVNVVAAGYSETPADRFSTVPDQNSATAQGETLTGVNPSRVRVTVRVDNVVSPPVDVPVRSNLQLAVTPNNPPANPTIVSIQQTQQFVPAITNDGPAGTQGVTWRVVKVVSGQDVNTTEASVNANGLFTATRVEGDFAVIATSVYDPNVTVRIPVRVESQVAVAITPATPGTISFRGGQQQFTATVSSVPEGQDQGVRWSVETQNGGTINSDGLYQAPNTPVANVRVRATSLFDNRKFTEVTFNVESLAVVNVTPATVPDPISIRTTLQFNGTVDNVPTGQDTSIVWTVEGGNANGTVDAGGLYTAPVTPGDYVVVATSRFDPNKTARRTVLVRSFVQINGLADQDISIAETRDFNATVTGVPEGFDGGLTWTIARAPGVPADAEIGTINADTGVYTAPNRPVTVVLTATSRFDPATSRSVTLRVVSNVAVTVTNPTATMSIKDTRDFDATVANVPAGADNGVTWTVTRATGVPADAVIGTINPDTGVYQSPERPVNVVITATSRLDPSRTASFNLNVVSNVVVATPVLQTEMSIREVRTFAATVTGVPAGGDTGVSWSVRLAPGEPPGANPGTIDAATGVYTAPGVPVRVILRARSNFDPFTAAPVDIGVNVVSNVVVTINPAGPVTLTINGRRTFTATVAGVIAGGDTGVTWSVQGTNSGTITPAGVYSAPATPGDYTIVATSVFDPARSRTVVVRVRSGNGNVTVQ